MSKKLIAVSLMALTLSACSNMSRQEQRALSGGAIGAAGGLALTAIVGGPLLAGAAVGAAGGAVVGAVTK